MDFNDYEKLITTRQSCRNYDGAPVSGEDIARCLEAARLAPSACNAQPYHIFVCTGSTAGSVAEATQGAGMNKFTSNVPCFFVIAEDSYNATAAAGSRLKNQDYRSVDIGIAALQLCLCAASLGLSTCILGWFDEKKLQKLLGTTAHIRLAIALGHSAPDDLLREKKRKPADQIATFLG